MFYMGFVEFISLFTPPVTLEIVYPISYMGVFLFHFHLAQAFVYLYIQYVYTFQLHNIEGVPTSTLRWKSFCWKIFLTIITIFLSIAVPMEKQPKPFQLFSKGKQHYDR